MEYRQLPHGSKNETLSVLGLGMGGIQGSSSGEIEAVIRKAVETASISLICAPAAKTSMNLLGRPLQAKGTRYSFSCILAPFTTTRVNMAGRGI